MTGATGTRGCFGDGSAAIGILPLGGDAATEKKAEHSLLIVLLSLAVPPAAAIGGTAEIAGTTGEVDLGVEGIATGGTVDTAGRAFTARKKAKR